MKEKFPFGNGADKTDKTDTKTQNPEIEIDI